MAPGAPAPTILTSSGVFALCPMGWEWRNTATTACSASRWPSPGTSRCTRRAIWSSFSSSVRQSVRDPSGDCSEVEMPARSATASDTPSTSGAASRADGPITGHSSQPSASRSAVARVRRIPRVRWNPVSWVQRL